MILNCLELWKADENKWFSGLIPVFCKSCSQTYFIDPGLARRLLSCLS